MELLFASMGHSARVMVFQIIPHQFVGIQFRGVRRQVEKPQFPLGFGHKFLHFLRAMHRVIVHNQKYWRGGISNKQLRNSQNILAFTLLSVAMNRNSPLGLMAEITFTLKRASVVTTTGVLPLGAQVVLE